MNVLIIGSGGREHAFAYKIAQSDKLNQLFVAPGNAGTAKIATNLPIGVSDFEEIKKAVLSNSISLVVVGPEAPLVEGIHDFFKADPELKDVGVIGPEKLAAQLEGSKGFSKEFMFRHEIPTAKYQTFSKGTVAQGKKFLETLKPPFVLKADGLAAGKGVLILDDLDQAKSELESMLVDAKFGEASSRVVIEEFLDGIELSIFVLTDGDSYKILPSAKDYKRIGEGDKGLNTGGMGAISPVPFADDNYLRKVEDRIVIPTVEGLKKDGIPYQGFIFIGLMNVDGDPFVIEYNVRMGDPETEVVLPRIKSDLLTVLEAASKKRLNQVSFELDDRTAATVMSVAGGYPEAYEKGHKISGLDQIEDAIVFHAGTKLDKDAVLTNGGRVFACTGIGDTMEEALEKAFNATGKVNFKDRYFRTDIGFDLR
ncbi:MAG: phosphoribosylamine--glycine ligase [Flavobacteriaceae bacterium]